MEKEKKPVYKKWWFWLIIIIVVIIGIAGSSGDTDSPKTTLTSGDTNNSVNTNENNDNKTEYHVGEIYEDKNIAIKYVSVNDNFTGYSSYTTVREGYKIISAEFEFENLGTTDQTVSSFDFTCYADGYACEDFWNTDNATFTSTLSSGRKTKGTVYFEVPKDATEIVLEYETNWLTSSKIKFIVK